MNFFKGDFIMRFYQKAVATAAANFLFTSYLFAAMPPGYTGTVFTGDTINGHAQQIPGLVLASYFDEGPDGVAYHYTDAANSGDCTVRNGHTGANVSIQNFGAEKDFVSGNVLAVDSACYPPGVNNHLGWIHPGEWENYTVRATAAGTYKMVFHESVTTTPNLIVVTFSGLTPDSVVNEPLSIRPPGDHEIWHDWKWDTTANLISLDTGLYVMNLEFFQEAGWNFAAINFILQGGASAVRETNRSPMQKGFAVMPIVNGKDLSVSYSLIQAGLTTVSVFDCAGRDLVPVTTQNLTAGSHVQKFDLSNRGTGVHFVRIEQNGLSETRSFTLTR